MKQEHFCVCPVIQCTRHPSNHSEACDPCIKNNLAKKSMPACFFHAVHEDMSDVTDYSIRGFVEYFNNGTKEDPGYNHNLYLGGTSVTVRNCEIARAVTGNNLKSRAHRNFIIGNRIHDSANRELDLVDAEGNTDVPDSDSFLIGNTIAKDPKCVGNKAVIHFGRDGKAKHDGTIWLIGNTIRTPFISPVVDVSSGVGVVFLGNVIDDNGAGQKGVLTKLHDPEMTTTGKGNTIPGRFIVRLAREGEKMPVELDDPPALPDDVKKILPLSQAEGKN